MARSRIIGMSCRKRCPQVKVLTGIVRSPPHNHKMRIEGILRAQLPMSGFDNAKVDAAFFEGTTWKSNFICNLGYGDSSKLRPRAPRLEFNEACKIL